MLKRHWIRYAPYGIVAILLLIAANFDLQINTFLYDPQNIMGMIFERFVLVPIVMVLPITCFAYYTLHKQRMALLCYALCCIYVVLDFIHFWFPLSSVLIPSFAGALAFMILLFLLLRFVPITFWRRHERFLLFTSLTFVSAILTTFVLKQCWGRVRYREMFPDPTLFTPWYLPQGINGHQSFPSGHTTAITVLLCTLEYHKAKGIHRRAGLGQSILVDVVILAMMLSRMIVGAHFLSDVSMGFCITYTYYLLYRMRFFREDFLT